MCRRPFFIGMPTGPIHPGTYGMTFKSFFLLLVAAVVSSAAIAGCSLAKPSSKILLQTTLKAAAAGSAAATNHEIGAGVQREWEQTLAPGESIYAARFSFDRATWSDIWSRPDVFLVIERDGGKRIVVPEIEYDWNYTPKVFNFRCPTLQSGERCVLRVYDDDGTADKVFKSLLTTPVHVQAGVNVPLIPVPAVVGEARASGVIQLLAEKDAKTLVLEGPDAIAAADFQVPSTAPWTLQGRFRQGNTDYGAVSLTHVHAHPLPGYIRNLLTPRLLFWGTLTCGLLVLAGGVNSLRRTKVQFAEEKLR